MHILHGFWRILRTTSFVLVVAGLSINHVFAADISIFNWTANIADGAVSGVARCGPKSGSTSTGAKSWVSTNWTNQSGGCFCRVQGIEDVSDWNDLNDAGSYWYGSGTNFSGGFEECSQNCATTCAQKFESDDYYQESLCGGTCPVSEPMTQYTINYDMDGGTGCASVQKYTDTATICTPSRDGYTFEGWMDNNTYEMYNGGDEVSNINLDLFAFWTIDNYTITYNLNEGTGCSNSTYTIENYITLCTPTRDGYIFDGWYDNSELTGNTITTISSGSTGNREYWAKWSQPTEWDCSDGIIDENADSWTTEIRQVGTDIPTAESLRSSTGIVTRAGNDGSYILNYQDQAEYQTNLDRYLTGEEFYVTWGLTTIRGWAGCSANSWNTEKTSYSTQTLTFTNAGCGCSIDKQNWIVKRNLLTQNGSTWDEKNEYCRANCPAACADAVANDYAFRTALFNGQCPASYVGQITCDPGYYLPGGANECKKCNKNGMYCTGGTFEQSDSDQGLTKCPDIVNYPGAYHTISETLVHFFARDYLNDSIETCAALFWFENPDVTGGSGLDRDAAYDANSPMNQNVILHTPFCFYNETTQMYDRCFTLPGIYYPTMCKNGYTINPELLTHVPDLGDNWSNADGETMHSVWNEQMNYLGNLVNPCVLGEKDYYTAFYDMAEAAIAEHSEVADYFAPMKDKVGVVVSYGTPIDMFAEHDASTFGKNVTWDDVYKACPEEYPNAPAGSWQKAHCYANLTYVFNDGTEDVVDKYYYSDSAVDGYQTNLPNAERNGYEFVGWYNNAEFDGDAVTNETVFAGNTTLYARWAPLSCEDGYYIDETQCSACPTGFTSDGEYAESIDDCYKISTVNCSDVNPYTFEHARDIIYGNSAHGVAPCKTYYDTENCVLDDENACVITGLTCENGYVLRGNDLIGINQDIDATNYTVSDYNWTAEFDYGTINGESMCSDTTPYYGVGYGVAHTDYEQCFCRIASYTKTNGEQTNINSRWANFGFIGNYIPATPDMTVIRNGQEVVIPGMQETYISRCSTRCPALCASAFAENSSNTTVGNGVYTNARNTLFNNATLLKCEPFDCQSGIWMHIGDNARACLSKQKTSNPAFVIEYDNTPYYLNMSSDDVPVNGTTNTKMKVYYHGNEYSIYDNSINN